MFRYLLVTFLAFVSVLPATAQSGKTATEYYSDGLKLHTDEKYEEALTAFKNAIAKNPNYKEALYKAGWTCNELEEYEDALIYLQKARLLWSDEPKIPLEMGYASYQLENADMAISYYREALRLDPESTTATNGLGNVYRVLKKDQNDAIYNYAKTLRKDPRNISANYWTGWCLNDLRKYREAIPYLKKVLEVDSKYVSAYTELGYSDYALKDYDAALDDFKKAFAIKKTGLTLYYTGLCFIGKKDKTSAMKLLDELKKMDSRFASDLQVAIDKM